MSVSSRLAATLPIELSLRFQRKQLFDYLLKLATPYGTTYLKVSTTIFKKLKIFCFTELSHFVRQSTTSFCKTFILITTLHYTCEI